MEFDELVRAMQTLNTNDAYLPRLSLEQWRTLAPYFTRHEIRAGDKLLAQGEVDRTMYLLAQGSLQVYVSADAASGVRRPIAILRVGAVAGEPGLFGDCQRLANVEAVTPCVVYALRGPRLEELSQRLPQLAYELLRAAGAVMVARMRNYLTKNTTFS